jgi:hypothetical protein
MRKVPQFPINDAEKPRIEERTSRLFAHCFEIARLEEGDSIPVGGESVWSPETNIQMEGDFENFQDFFDEVLELASKYNLPKLKEWLDSQGVEMNEKTFASLFAFTKKFEEKRKENPNRASDRRMLYTERKDLKLSDVFKGNIAECAEIAALTQAYIQKTGINSSYFSGDVLWRKDQEFPEAHSLIVIREGDKTYLYDPTNPTETNQGKYPSIYTTESNFDMEVRKGQKRFVSARNLLNGKEVFFGVSDGTAINPNSDIV